MNKKYNKWFLGGLLTLLVIFGVTSCSDDHFEANTSTNASGTLWENILATQKCDSFAMILSKTIVNKKEYGNPATLTYDALLNSNRAMTVWAPVDGTYNASKWLKMLENGDNESVEIQFVANHMTYFNYNGSFPEKERLILANGKYADYDHSNGANTFNGVNILNAYKNIPSVNGSLHVLESVSPFSPNLREFFELNPSLSLLSKYVESRDTVVFVPGQSTPGTTVNGIVHYVDSVFSESNKVLEYRFNATNEDSLTAAIFPSNSAWQTALEKVSKSYNYKNHNYYYIDKESKLPNDDTIKADSVREISTIKAIFYNMFYSLEEQRGFDTKNASKETVGEYFRSADSLMSVAYYSNDNLYHQHAPECWTLAEGKDPEVCSNGYAFITDAFNFKANKAWQFDIKFDGEDAYYINVRETTNTSTAMPTGNTIRLSENTINPNVIGKLSGDMYREFAPQSATGKVVAAYNIPNCLSGKYDIYVVIVPENIGDSLNKNPKNNMFTATVAYDIDKNGKAISKTTAETFTSDPTKIDTIRLFSDFEFPYAYKGLTAKPFISINSQYTTKVRQTTSSTLRIDKFLFISKDE